MVPWYCNTRIHNLKNNLKYKHRDTTRYHYGEEKTSIRGFFRGFRSRFSKKPRTKPRSRKKTSNGFVKTAQNLERKTSNEKVNTRQRLSNSCVGTSRQANHRSWNGGKPPFLCTGLRFGLSRKKTSKKTSTRVRKMKKIARNSRYFLESCANAKIPRTRFFPHPNVIFVLC